MSVNKYGEVELCEIHTDGGDLYCICRDRGGFHVLRQGGFNGKELFAPRRDDGRKNTKKGRVYDASILYKMIQNQEY